jgi:hypothetical protein
MTNEPVLVKWRDITTSGLGWMEQEAVDDFVTDSDEAIVYQLGFLYEQDEHQIVLIDSYFHGKGMWGNVTKIPKGCVIEITKLT